MRLVSCHPLAKGYSQWLPPGSVLLVVLGWYGGLCAAAQGIDMVFLGAKGGGTEGSLVLFLEEWMDGFAALECGGAFVS